MGMQDVAEAMRSRREQLGLTQVDACAEAGVSRSTWRDVEKGRRPGVLPATALRIDGFLGWPPGTTARLFRDG